MWKVDLADNCYAVRKTTTGEGQYITSSVVYGDTFVVNKSKQCSCGSDCCEHIQAVALYLRDGGVLAYPSKKLSEEQDFNILAERLKLAIRLGKDKMKDTKIIIQCGRRVNDKLFVYDEEITLLEYWYGKSIDKEEAALWILKR
jgi:hypothetical protein